MPSLDDLLFRLSPKRDVHGIPTAIIFSSKDERALAFGRIEAALDLIAQHAPMRYRRVLRDCQRILVTSGHPGVKATYDQRSRTCSMNVYWLLRPTTEPLEIAGSIVHEAEHGRLFRLGFEYTAATSHRIERICFRSMRVFARRVPSADSLVQEAATGMELDEKTYTWSAHYERQARAIDVLDTAPWMRKFLLAVNRFASRRMARKASSAGRPTMR